MIKKITELIERQVPLVVVRIYHARPAGLPTGSLIAITEKEVFGDYPHCLAELLANSREALRHGKSSVKQIVVEDITLDVCFDVIMPEKRLLIVGAGHIAVPLYRIAHVLGFSMIVIDDRAEYANRERFPEADEIIVAPFAEVLADYPFNENSYVVLITRGHVYDVDCLMAVLNKPTAYIGMICSQRRKIGTFKLMQERGYSRQQLAKVFAPIGLPTGGETPEEIALSIMAEIVAVYNHGSEFVRQLRDIEGKS